MPLAVLFRHSGADSWSAIAIRSDGKYNIG
jgi:hypothetical protein